MRASHLSQPFHLLYFSSLLLLLYVSSLLLLLFHIPTTANAQNQKPLYHTCDNTTTYTSTSTFATNLKLLLPSLSSNSSLSLNRGFYNGIIGQASNTIYGQILCRGDTESTECQDCINKASDSILSLCSSRSAAIWYDTCQLRYSDTNFFRNSTSPLWFYVWSRENITDPDLGPFKEGLVRLMNDLASKTEAQPWRRNFVTNDTIYTGFRIVYGLVQCVPDISGTDCHTCLKAAISRIPDCCVNRIGGRVIGHVCGLWFETTHKFYNESKVADPAPPPSPAVVPPPPSTTTPSPGRGKLALCPSA